MLMSDVVYQSSQLTIGPTAKACKNTIGPVRISLTGQYNLFRKFSEWWFGPESQKKVYREDWYTCTHMFIHLMSLTLVDVFKIVDLHMYTLSRKIFFYLQDIDVIFEEKQ